MKKRHIDIIVTKIEYDQVHFKIKQTHRGKEFSNQNKICKFMAANGYVLYSLHLPKFGEDSKILFCLGKHEYDDTICTCNREELAEILEAVSEYNETNGTGYWTYWPKIGDRYFVIEECMTIESFTFQEHPFDIDHKNCGNFFRTREEAENVRDKMQLLLKEYHTK